jgi:lysophospholipase L1-like esterase
MSGDVRMCFFGDSFVNGTHDEAYLGWPGRLSAQLRSIGLELTTYNLGIRRDTSRDIAARWRDEAARRLPERCDGRLVFSFGVNDCVEEAGVCRVPAAESLGHAERIFAAATSWKPTLVLGPPAMSWERQDTINQRIRVLSDGQQALCARLGIPFIDLFTVLAAAPEWGREIAAGDGVHPGHAGYERMAAIVLAWPGWSGWLASPA